MAAISCGNCGGEHATVAEVRSCHTDRPSLIAHDLPPEPGTTFDEGVEPEPPGPSGPPGLSGPSARRSPAPVTTQPSSRASPTTRAPGPVDRPAVPVRVPLDAPPDSWAGPDALGRWIAVRPGQPVPAAWSNATRVTIDAADPAAALALLEPRWLARERTVVEVPEAFDVPPPDLTEQLPWQVGPRFTFVGERLWHLLWSNTVDARTVGSPRWPWAEIAVGAGARPGGPADVLLADGRPAWCDGGPLAPLGPLEPGGSREGVLVHRIALERASLEPVTNLPCRADLAPDQLAAVVHHGAAAAILAPAGSGKTRVLTERARHLLHDWHVPASALTLVAFNVRAADEMRERTTDLPGLQVRTLNALALAIVNGTSPFAPRGARLATIDEREVRRILDGLVTFNRKANTDPSAVWLEALSAVRLALRSPVEVEASFGGEVPGFADVFPLFRAALAERRALDFDEQITAATIALLTEPATRAAAQRACRLLLVDEFQDLAPAHVLLLRLLASPDLAVYGVGDDDQTIYGYTGATPDWLIDFTSLFPDAGQHPLTVNYRCPPRVVTAASNLLTRNARRVDKVIRARPGRADEPDALTVRAVDDLVEATVEAVQGLVAAGASPASIAVLTRVSSSLAPVQVALGHHGVATQGGVDTRWLERTGVRAALAWLRMASEPGQLRSTDIETAARRPSRGMSANLIGWMANRTGRGALSSMADRLTNQRDSDKVASFVTDLDQVAALARQGATTSELLRTVRARIGLDDALSRLDQSRADSQAAHLDDLDALVALAGLHPAAASFESWLVEQLGRADAPDGVVLATIHKVKGREWPHVVLHDVRAGVLPHRLSTDAEEERRVFHVGLTRGSQTVTIIGGTGDDTCPFVAELDSPGTPPASRLVTSRGAPDGTRSIAGVAGAAGAGPRGSGGAAGTGGASRTRGASGSRAAAAVPATLDAAGEQVRDALRAWRTARASSDAVPPYVVLTNVTLDAIAKLRPSTLDELSRLPGIGPAKRERYGTDILEVVATSS